MPSVTPVPSSDCTLRAEPEIIDQARRSFQSEFGVLPAYVAVAPGRVNLIGEHVDYNDGFVFPMAISRYVVVAGRPMAGPVAEVFSLTHNQKVKIPLDGVLQPGEPAWANYLRGVIAGFRERGVTVPGFEAVVAADLPMGGGLSSSAALEVAVCCFLEALTGHSVPEIECIRLCQKAEHTFAGVPCGIMDQFIVRVARKDHALLLDCESLERRHVALPSDDVSLIVTHSGVAHELGKGEYAKRRADCQRAARVLGVPSLRSADSDRLASAGAALDTLAMRRARHVVGEIARTLQFAECLDRREWGRAGELMYASHGSLRDDYEVSCPELNHLVDIARELGPGSGVYGARLTGAGFGGCTITLVKRDAAAEVCGSLVDAYRRRSGIAAHAFLSAPVAGARLLGFLSPG